MINRTPELIDGEKYQKFSVVIPLIKTQKGYEVLFEIRADGLRKQPGEICFPGGRAEAGETPWQTAEREMCEELMIHGNQLKEQMPMDIFLSPFGMIIHPFAAILEAYDGHVNPAEVRKVFTVPLSFFQSNEPQTYQCDVTNHPAEDFPFEKIPGGKRYPWRSGTYEVNFYEYGEYLIWGLTAKIMKASVCLIQNFIKLWEEKCNEEKKE